MAQLQPRVNRHTARGGVACAQQAPEPHFKGSATQWAHALQEKEVCSSQRDASQEPRCARRQLSMAGMDGLEHRMGAVQYPCACSGLNNHGVV